MGGKTSLSAKKLKKMYRPLHYLYYRGRNQVHTFVPYIAFCLPPRKNLVTNKEFFPVFPSMPLSFVPWKNPRSTIFCTAFQNPRVTPKRKNKLLAGESIRGGCLFSLHLQPRRYLFFNLGSYDDVKFEQLNGDVG